jgi:kynurenine formamidase
MTDQRAETPRQGPQLLDRDIVLIDLSRQIYEGMPIWGAHQRPFMMVNQTHQQFRDRFGSELGFEAHNWLLSEHTGTHTDAVFEYEPLGGTLDRMPLAYYYGDAVCLDVSGTRYPDFFTPEVLQRAVETSGQELNDGDIVLLHTGHGARTWPNAEYLDHYAGLDRAGATWLAERGVVNIGVDAVAIDQSDDGTYAAHAVCGEYRIVNTENLTNLEQLIGKRFTYIGLPLPFKDGTGSPVRAVAWLGS